MLTGAFLVMQFIISAKAGLVNDVEGAANVQIQQQVQAGALIQTGPAGRVEVLLNPGSFLRLGESSQAALDSVELTNIGVRILSGSAVIESGNIEKDSPIRVAIGQLTLLIVSPGLYRFGENTASVLDGEIRTVDSGLSIHKGWQITANGDQYEEERIPSTEPVTSLDQWSQQRSEQIAAANSRSSETDSASNNQTPAYQGFLYPWGALPYGFTPGGASPTPFSFFQSYPGGYSFFQPLTPGPQVLFYSPFIVPPVRPILRPPTNLYHPPATAPTTPAPHPVAPRPRIVAPAHR